MDEFIERNQCGKGESRNRTVSRESRANELEDHTERHAYICIAPSPGPRRGSLEGKREQCRVSTRAYMRISVRSLPDATYES